MTFDPRGRRKAAVAIAIVAVAAAVFFATRFAHVPSSAPTDTADPSGRMHDDRTQGPATTVAGGDEQVTTAAGDTGIGDGSTLLDAIAREDVAGVDRLLSAGANPDSIDADGLSALAHAIQLQNAEITELLLAAGANLDTRPGAEPILVTAIQAGDATLTLDLLQRGAPVNPAADGGDSPLVTAIDDSDESIVEALLNAGADANAMDGSGRTPLSAAIDAGSADAVSFLLRAGARTDTPGQDGSTPLQLARDAGESEIVELLERAGAGD